MNVAKKYPQLFETLAAKFNKRDAARMIKNTGLTHHHKRDGIVDTTLISGAFVWNDTKQGKKYWSDIANNRML